MFKPFWRQISTAWLIAVWSSGFLLGVLLVQLGFLNIEIYFGISLALVAILFKRRLLIFIPLVLLSGVLFGLWRGGVLLAQIDIYKNLYGQVVIIKGKIREDVELKNDDQISFRLAVQKINNQLAGGELYVTTSTASKGLMRGDEVKFLGKLQTGFGGFVGSIYRATIQEIKHSKNPILISRDHFSKIIRENLKEREANLGVGLLLGQRRSLGQDLMIALQLTGMMHIVVASGYNLTVLTRFGRRLFGRISKYWALMGSMVLVVLFMIVTGLSPSMLRAGLVSMISLLAWYYGRKLNPLVLLITAMTLTVLYNPFYLWGDLGWQLSFASFAGVMLLAPLIEKYFFGDKTKNSLRQIVVESFSAQLLTAPIIIFTFREFSNVSLLVNLLVLPLVPLAMFLVFLVGGAGLLFGGGWLVGVLSRLAQLILSYFTKVIFYWSEVSWAMSQIQVNFLTIIVSYSLVVFLGVYLYWRTKDKPKEYNLVA